MSAGDEEAQRGKHGGSHAASVAHLLACWVALACGCDDGSAAPPVDPDDLDGDGIPNERDDCPLARDPVQHDEDGDGLGDVCDVCPTVADPPQLDRGEVDALAFEDGVGDACDPRPSRGGDQLVALHTFATDTTPSWIGAGWTIDGDRVSASGAARWLARRAHQGDTLAARLAVASVTWLAPGGAVEIALDGDGVQIGSVCALVADRDADGNDELLLREVGGAQAVQQLVGPVSGPVTIIMARGIERSGTGAPTGRLRCRIELGDADASATIATIDDTTSGQYAIAAAAAAVSATSLAVYTSPVACPAALLACPAP